MLSKFRALKSEVRISDFDLGKSDFRVQTESTITSVTELQVNIGPELMSPGQNRFSDTFVQSHSNECPLGEIAKGSAVMRRPKTVVSLVLDKDALYATLTWPLGLYCIFL